MNLYFQYPVSKNPMNKDDHVKQRETYLSLLITLSKIKGYIKKGQHELICMSGTRFSSFLIVLNKLSLIIPAIVAFHVI